MSAITSMRQARHDPARPRPRLPRPLLTKPPDSRHGVLRRRALWLLMVVLLAVASGGAAVAVAQPSPVTPTPCPQPGASSPTPCPPAPPPSGHPQTPPSTTSSAPVTTTPGTTAPSTTTPSPPPVTPLSPPSGECGITDIGACMADGINSFFWALVVAALNSLLRLVAQTLLATPTLDQLPRIGELWESSRGIAVASYALLIMVSGIVVMAYETLQARTTIRQAAPRLVVGFLAANLSWILAAKAIEFANALSYALVGGGVDPKGAAETLSALLTNTVLTSITSSGFVGILIALGLVVLLVSLSGSYVVRVALTAVLVAGAPLALSCHGSEQTEGVAWWWWRAFFGVLGIQIGQSLTLITALRVFFSEGGFTFFGPTPDGVVNLIATGGLLWILVKIPSWVMHHVQLGGGRRSMLGSLVRAFVAYKTFGLLRGRGGSGTRSLPAGGGSGRGRGASSGGGGPANPYAHARTTASGQYMLPLTGLRRSRPAAAPKSAPVPKPSGGHGRQLTLPLDGDWPENKPVLGRDGQYRLPLDVERVKPTPPPPVPPGTSRAAGRRRGGQQLELPFDPYRGNRPDRSGQYPLPLEGVRRTPRPPSPAPAPAPPAPRARGTQPQLPFDPYKGNRPTRSGQYPLPLDGVRRVPPATPAPPPPPPPRAASPAGRQLRLPLDLPTRPRRSSPPPPTSGGTP